MLTKTDKEGIIWTLSFEGLNEDFLDKEAVDYIIDLIEKDLDGKN